MSKYAKVLMVGAIAVGSLLPSLAFACAAHQKAQAKVPATTVAAKQKVVAPKRVAPAAPAAPTQKL